MYLIPIRQDLALASLGPKGSASFLWRSSLWISEGLIIVGQRLPCWPESLKTRTTANFVFEINFKKNAINIQDWSSMIDMFFLPKNTQRKTGVILTQKVESLVELKFDKGFRVIWLKYSPITRNPGSNFSCYTSDSTLWVKMSPCFFIQEGYVINEDLRTVPI